ncbi:MAG: hypothetical protein J7604_15385 [Sporocytophaga sp.]|uniref:hypothetical protein n=1 Tax=Sporocytophaga sp. TaxID=2231183 RepID=UPI001B0F10FD|nr:hypothetical protein [Sporocytophaga sp.]MBO9701590.1 hypothetical protein [Sporocytophaga sp.]
MLNNISPYNKHKIIIFSLISFFLFTRLLLFVEPMFGGDMFEYYLMTEGFKNHFSVDLRIEDIESFDLMARTFYPGNGFLEIVKNEFPGFLERNKEFMQDSWGYFTDLNGDKYSYHFWLYSLINVPVSILLGFLNMDGLKSFQITNFLIAFFSCIYTLFFSRLEESKRIFLTAFFFFSATLWYIPFPGPEVFSISFFFLALILYYEKKYYGALLFLVLGSTQNPPIIFFAPVICLKLLRENGFTLKNILSMGFIGVLCLAPSAFYYYNFGIPNIIIHKGYLANNHLSFTRFLGFFFDLNQGLFLAIPILFLIWVFTYIKKIKKGPKSWDFDLLFLPISMLMVFTFINMHIWNGGANVHRYASWSSIPFLVFALYHFNYETKFGKTIISTVLIFQILFVYNILGFLQAGEFNCKGYMIGKHNPLSKFVMNNYPDYYNPDPDIFLHRTVGGGYSADNSPVIYYDDKNQVRKISVHFSKVNELNDTLKNNNKKMVNIHFVNGWGYINF